MMGIVTNLHTSNSMALALSAAALLVCMAYKSLLEQRVKRKIPFPVPIDLVIVSFPVFAATC